MEYRQGKGSIDEGKGVQTKEKKYRYRRMERSIHRKKLSLQEGERVHHSRVTTRGRQTRGRGEPGAARRQPHCNSQKE